MKLNFNKRDPVIPDTNLGPPKTRRRYYGLASSLILSSAMALPSLANAGNLTVNGSYTLSPGGYSYDKLELRADSTLFIEGNTTIFVNSLRSETGATIRYYKSGYEMFAKSAKLTLKVTYGSAIKELSIIGTGRDGGTGSHGSPGSDGRDAYIYHKYGIPKCRSANAGGAGGNGGNGGDAENGMSIEVEITNLNPEVSIDIVSNGGTGGRGGNGGNGGNGGDGNHACTSGKDGGRGGNSGMGGKGGNGGTITTKLTYSNDAIQDQINEGLKRLKVTVNGGKGGPPGTPGTGGRGGDGKGLGSSGFVHNDGSNQSGGNGKGWGSNGASGDHERLQVPPSAPSEPSPKSWSKDIEPKDLVLAWKASTDSNEDKVTYDVVYWEEERIKLRIKLFCSDPSTPSCRFPKEKLVYGKKFFWQVEAKDGHNKPVIGGPWSFQIKGNEPPSNPTNPVIKNGGNEIDPAQTEVDPKLSGEFSWTASEEPEGDQVFYKVCYKKVNEEAIKCYSETSETSKTFDQLDYGASYEWRVVAEDSSGNIAEWYSNEEELEKWTFRTEAAPAVIKLTANSGHENTALDWKTTNAELFKIAKYRVLRVHHAKDSNTPPVFDSDKDKIAITENAPYTVKVRRKPAEERYCYQVDGLDIDGKLVSSSGYDKSKTCVTPGEVTLVIDSISALDQGEVPIRMPNGGDLEIGTADLCLKYDSRVITVTDVNTQAFSDDFTFEYSVAFPDIIKISVSPDSMGFGEPVLMGAGNLVEISFDVKENRPQDFSDLEWFEAADNQDLVLQYPALNSCISIWDNQEPYQEKITSLGLRDGSFQVRNGYRFARDGQRTTARFYVRTAYSKGDLDGDGIVGTIDARFATGIGIGYYLATPEQLDAGDVNGDNQINEADARVIAHYVLHGEWLDDVLPSKTRSKPRRRQRDGKDTPILISIEEISGVSGSQVTVPLTVENLTDLTAVNFKIAYNQAVVNKVKVKKAGLAADASLFYYDNKAGIVGIGIRSEQPISGSGEIATLTLHLATEGTVNGTPLAIAKTNLYDDYGRDFATSILQRQIEKQHGKLTITDIEEPIEDRAVVTPIEAILPVGFYGAACKVSDQDGNPIVDVTVKVGYKTVITDESGYCTIIGLVAGEYHVKATKEGYVFLDTQCVVGEEQNCRLDIVNVNGKKAAPAKCQVYAVHDGGLNRSQFVTIGIDEHEISELGPMYRGYDIEALAIDPRTNIIYAASGNNVTNKYPKGHFYVVDGESGELFPVGGIGFGELFPVGSTGFEEIGDLTFSQDGTLWAWAKNEGLITIDITTGKGNLVFASDLPIEGLTLLEEGSPTFYGAVNTELWYYDTSTGALEVACTNLPGETEAIKGISAELFLISIHEGQIFAFNPQTCELGDAISTNEYNDVEGIALPVAACTK